MTSFITTMFVSPVSSSPNTRFPPSPKPLPPVYTLPPSDNDLFDAPFNIPHTASEGRRNHSSTGGGGAGGAHSRTMVAGGTWSGDAETLRAGDDAVTVGQAVEETRHALTPIRARRGVREADIAFNPLAINLVRPTDASTLRQKLQAALRKQLTIAASVPLPVEDDSSSPAHEKESSADQFSPETLANVAYSFLERHLRQADGFITQPLCGGNASATSSTFPSIRVPTSSSLKTPHIPLIRATNVSSQRIEATITDMATVHSNSRSRAPFKPNGKAGRGTSSWQLKQFAEATLGSGSLRKAVMLPEGEDKDEWMAVNGT
jgi:hypothetical protein